MRLLNANLRLFLLYAVLVLLVGTPVSFVVIREILQRDIDETLMAKRYEFEKHLAGFATLADLEMDLVVMDNLSHDLDIIPYANASEQERFATVSVYDSVDQEIKPYRELVSRIEVHGKPYQLAIRMSLVDNDQLVLFIVVVMTILNVLLITGLFFINRASSERVLAPFYQTLQKLKAYELDKHETFDYEPSRFAEFNALNETLRALTTKNRQVFMQQKAFIENASHELQTPLAVFQVKLDLLMQSPDLTAGQALLVKDMMEMNQRMTKLNKTLLLLSKIDNDQFIAREMVAVHEILQAAIVNFQLLKEHTGITLLADITPLTSLGNRDLIDILVNNLLRNAYRHNIPQGSVWVKLDDRSLTVRNTGEPATISPEQMFARFGKGRVSSDGIGLGLAIVSKICDFLHYEILYQYNEQEGIHTFQINFREALR